MSNAKIFSKCFSSPKIKIRSSCSQNSSKLSDFRNNLLNRICITCHSFLGTSGKNLHFRHKHKKEHKNQGIQSLRFTKLEAYITIGKT